ncbi:MAG: YARHG domain-containing protein [Thaumarchaeota archaeon]|nr:YARHG domain-containing protein [Nitrososphaerota archaeon]
MHKMRYVITIIFLIQSFASFAQKEVNFDDFLNLFPGKKIDSVYQVKYLEQSYFPQYQSLRAVKIKERTKPYITVIVQIDCFAGGVCESQQLYTFSKDGKLIDQFQIHNQKSDCSFSNEKRTEFFDVLFYTTTIEEEIDCATDSIKNRKIRIDEVEITQDGEIELKSQRKIPSNRNHPNLSYHKLDAGTLNQLDEEKLAEMRNEIFASYGYDFKTDRWKNFFEAFTWYQPSKQSVLKDELNLIEQYNLELIVSEENNR